MRKLIGVTVLSAIALSLPQAAQAQRRATSAGMGGAEHELGVDIGVAYTKPSNVSGGITIQTPFDVRVGFVPSPGNIRCEARAGANSNRPSNVVWRVLPPRPLARLADSALLAPPSPARSPPIVSAVHL